MAEIAKTGTPSLTSPPSHGGNWLPPYPVGEDIDAGDACAIDSDGKIYKSDGTASGTAKTTARVDGWAPQSAKVGQGDVLSLCYNVSFSYSSAAAVGTLLYLSSTVKGGVTDTLPGTPKTAAPVAVVLPADNSETRKKIRVFQAPA